MTLDVNIMLADLPCSIKGYTVANPDLSYTIVLNSRLSFEQQHKTAEHERYHIENGDYDRRVTIDLLECYAHALT